MANIIGLDLKYRDLEPSSLNGGVFFFLFVSQSASFLLAKKNKST